MESWCACRVGSTDNDFNYLHTQYSWFEVRGKVQARIITRLQTRLITPNGSSSQQGIMDTKQVGLLLSQQDHKANITHFLNVLKQVACKGTLYLNVKLMMPGRNSRLEVYFKKCIQYIQMQEYLYLLYYLLVFMATI